MTTCSRCHRSDSIAARVCRAADCELRQPAHLHPIRSNPAAATGSALDLPVKPPAAEPVHHHVEELAA